MPRVTLKADLRPRLVSVVAFDFGETGVERRHLADVCRIGSRPEIHHAALAAAQTDGASGTQSRKWGEEDVRERALKPERRGVEAGNRALLIHGRHEEVVRAVARAQVQQQRWREGVVVIQPVKWGVLKSS